MIHSYNKNNSEYDFFGLKSDKKKKSEGDAYPYRADLNYDSAPSLLGRIASSDDTPSLFAPQSEGERIRKQLQSAVDKALGKGKYSGLFDGIDTKKIEDNIPVAESVIKKNKEKNAYSMEDTKNLPNLRGGLAAFYALSEAGNHKAANAARKIAYTPYTSAEKKQETQSRYVGEDNLLLHSAPGERAPDVASLSRGDEVYFTGNKTNETDGSSWAEVKYGDKTGWVRSNSLKTDKSQAFAGKRYVGEETISMRAVPGMRGHTKDTIDYGKEVHFTGNKETLDGIDWAEVEYGGKTGWVIADYLKTKKSNDMLYTAEWTDEDKLREAYAKAKHPDSDVYGDFDNHEGLQCVDATNWFIDTYTTLERTTGNGYQKVENIAALRPDLEISTIPSAPAVYSIAPEKPGPGVRNLSDRNSGHTGIVLDVRPHPQEEGKYILKIFHTYTGLLENGVNCAIKEYEFTPNDGVTFVNISNYLK